HPFKGDNVIKTLETSIRHYGLSRLYNDECGSNGIASGDNVAGISLMSRQVVAQCRIWMRYSVVVFRNEFCEGSLLRLWTCNREWITINLSHGNSRPGSGREKECYEAKSSELRHRAMERASPCSTGERTLQR